MHLFCNDIPVVHQKKPIVIDLLQHVLTFWSGMFNIWAGHLAPGVGMGVLPLAGRI